MYKYEPSDGASPLRRFIALPGDSVLVLGARRTPPVKTPTASTVTSVTISTSVGFRQLSVRDYAVAVSRLRPDIVVGLGDIPFVADSISRNRIDKINDRTSKWLIEQLDVSTRCGDGEAAEARRPALFAPLLPLPVESQKSYLDILVENMCDIGGLVSYDPVCLPGLPSDVATLPRLSLSDPRTPHHLLRELSMGIDICTVAFVSRATDAGIALTFTFPPPPLSAGEEAQPQSLGTDMWQHVHATSITPLSLKCTCYTCTKHHRAYVQHLLVAKEMLGWVLLQIHNHQILDSFFSGIRASIAGNTFERDCTAFARYYEPELPETSGLGPRVRGYQFKSDGPGEAKRNLKAYSNNN